MTDKSCGTCTHFKSYTWLDKNKWDADEPGECTWTPHLLLMSWKYAQSEVIGVSADTNADECPQWSRDES